MACMCLFTRYIFHRTSSCCEGCVRERRTRQCWFVILVYDTIHVSYQPSTTTHSQTTINSQPRTITQSQQSMTFFTHIHTHNTHTSIKLNHITQGSNTPHPHSLALLAHSAMTITLNAKSQPALSPKTHAASSTNAQNLSRPISRFWMCCQKK